LSEATPKDNILILFYGKDSRPLELPRLTIPTNCSKTSLKTYYPHSFHPCDMALLTECTFISGAQSAGLLDIHFTVGTSCERAAPLAEKNAAVQHHVLGSSVDV
jgi:hypothetical protein